MEPAILDLSDLSDHPSERSAPEFDQKQQQAPSQKDLSQKARQKLTKQSNYFKEQLSVLDQYFQVAESSIKELRSTTDLQQQNEVDKKADKKRRQALNAGQAALNAVNDNLKPLQNILDQQKHIEEKEWETNPKLYGTYTADFRIQQELLQAASKKFVAVCHSFSEASMGTKAALEQKVKRIFRLVNSSLSDQQIDQVLEAEGPEALQQMMTMSSNQYDAILLNAKEKHQTCVNINRTAQEIKQMTLDFAALVQQQSETIDRIEQQVCMARENVQEGIKNLQKANDHARKAKRCMCFGICLLAVGAVVVLLIVMGVIKAIK
ncbi:Syntaxin_1A [Hexamita inflata]|uniref:Syntaxin 1A n=1 Tax=Hexamita inflata TaxID=28002 RepID=A0AA86R2W2_9EUKA|nr:Syntaxin 1A [Hexamita inflata]CAI9945678.1 Syntaxin 1A [Hexamita inflata]CAI9965192.1 Syntaxin 1A [Hexamita inflata]